jgi:hypothetical protein
MRSLRKSRGDEKKIYLSINTQKPPPRNALVIKDKEKFENALLKDIEAGKKIIFHCSSKENVKRICNSIKNKCVSNEYKEKKQKEAKMKEEQDNMMREDKKEYNKYKMKEERNNMMNEDKKRYQKKEDIEETSDDDVDIEDEETETSDDDDNYEDENARKEKRREKRKKKAEEKKKKKEDKKNRYKVLIYHGDMDDKLKMKTATNVNKYWKKYCTTS